MRNLILQEWLSLDGLASGPNDSVDFVPAATRGDQSFGRHQLEFIGTLDTIVLGRVTYQLFAGYWPAVTEGEEKPFADQMNQMSKVVFSTTLDRAPWGNWGDARIVRNGAEREVAELKARPGKDMVVWGSLSLAGALMNAGLVDRYRLLICPAVLGSGRRLFDEKLEGLRLKLSDTKRFDGGAVLLEYVPSGSGR